MKKIIIRVAFIVPLLMVLAFLVPQKCEANNPKVDVFYPKPTRDTPKLKVWLELIPPQPVAGDDIYAKVTIENQEEQGSGRGAILLRWSCLKWFNNCRGWQLNIEGPDSEYLRIPPAVPMPQMDSSEIIVLGPSESFGVIVNIGNYVHKEKGTKAFLKNSRGAYRIDLRYKMDVNVVSNLFKVNERISYDYYVKDISEVSLEFIVNDK